MNLLFICTGNSCRSQMAEGWARELGGDLLNTNSAGLEAQGQNPRAIEVMAEAGVDISHQQSTRLDESMLGWADYVITVCGHAQEHCPMLPPGTRKDHWPLPDPAKAVGTEEEILAVFRESRDEIRRRAIELINHLRMQREEETAE